MQIEHINGSVQKQAIPALSLVKVTDQKVVRDYWPQIRKGCLAVKSLDPYEDAGHWTPEHVRAQIELGLIGKSTVCLHLIVEIKSGKFHGFLVSVVANCPYMNVPLSLIVWVAYTFNPIGSQARSILRQIEDYGRDLGLKYLDGYYVPVRKKEHKGRSRKLTATKWPSWLERYGTGYRPAQNMVRKSLY